MDILLIAGLWLDGSAWDEVASALEPLSHRAVPITLPGQYHGSAPARPPTERSTPTSSP